ncbi:MAG TPA: hemolysin family protein [Candidatus Acidoferrales bacterium]|nr:hemolysin family protein [Candidatus Acidoferrales bacterium]
MNGDAVILTGLKILAVLALVLMNAFFVTAELAMVRIRDTQLAALSGRRNRRARTARHILAHIDAYIGATQFGITMASLGLGMAVEPVFNGLLGPLFHLLGVTSDSLQHHIALGVGFFTNCYLLIVAGELVPKAIAIRRTLRAALLTAGPLAWFYRVSFPFIWLLNKSSQLIVTWLGVGAEGLQGAQSEDELRVILGAAQGSPDRRNLILNALDLRQRTAREVMRPRNEVTVFDSSATIAECIGLAEKTRYSRFPICDDGDPDKARGVIHIKDLYAFRDRAKTAADLLPLARKLICVPETVRLERLLQRFLEKKSHFAFVVDEFGGTRGIVTLENVIEAIVGQIQDEFDAEATQFIRRSENVWEVSGTLPVHDLEAIIGPVPHDDGVATASGWVTQRLGGFPKTGDTFAAGDYELHVDAMDGLRVARLKITQVKIPDNTTTISSREPQKS